MLPRNPIPRTMIPSQEQSRQAAPAPRAFGPNDWAFNPLKPVGGVRGGLDFVGPDQARQSNQNYFAKNEGWQQVKSGMFGPLTGREPVAGHVNFFQNQLQQEQTNGHTTAFKMQGVTRVADNMNPVWVMNNPSYHYPYKPWQYVYTGAR